jgi:hypothetical protein
MPAKNFKKERKKNGLTGLFAVADPAGFSVVPGLPQIPGDQGNGAL